LAFLEGRFFTHAYSHAANRKDNNDTMMDTAIKMLKVSNVFPPYIMG